MDVTYPSIDRKLRSVLPFHSASFFFLLPQHFNSGHGALGSNLITLHCLIFLRLSSVIAVFEENVNYVIDFLNRTLDLRPYKLTNNNKKLY